MECEGTLESSYGDPNAIVGMYCEVHEETEDRTPVEGYESEDGFCNHEDCHGVGYQYVVACKQA